jgi:D-glycero-alpha-D-manno-heptose 1-phosphate guanylyltransferase
VSVPPEKITAVVLAGGFGRRIQHLLPDLPKPMVPVNGRPFLEWVVRYLAAQKILRVILSTGHLAGAVEKHFHSQPVKNVHVSCVPETKPLGTAGGFLNAIHGTKEKPEGWLVLNGDSLAPTPLDEMFQSLDDPEWDGAILGLPMIDASRFGTISQNMRGRLTGFNEKRAGEGVINAGVYLFRTWVVGKFPPKKPLSFETDVFPTQIADGMSLKVCVTDAPFLDIGTPESLPQAESFIQKNLREFLI